MQAYKPKGNSPSGSSEQSEKQDDADRCDGCDDPTGFIIRVVSLNGEQRLCRDCRDRMNRILPDGVEELGK